jgi:hypothetical protein
MWHFAFMTVEQHSNSILQEEIVIIRKLLMDSQAGLLTTRIDFGLAWVYNTGNALTLPSSSLSQSGLVVVELRTSENYHAALLQR